VLFLELARSELLSNTAYVIGLDRRRISCQSDSGTSQHVTRCSCRRHHQPESRRISSQSDSGTKQEQPQQKEDEVSEQPPQPPQRNDCCCTSEPRAKFTLGDDESIASDRLRRKGQIELNFPLHELGDHCAITNDPRGVCGAAGQEPCWGNSFEAG
jgi:hypothetical protein